MKRKRFEAFSCPEKHSLPFNLPFTGSLTLFHALDKGFHPVRTGALHFTGYVPVYVQRERRSVVPKVLLNRLYIVASCNAILQHPEHSFMLANIDRQILGERAGLECKTTSAYNRTDFEGGSIPPYFYWQCMHYLDRAKRGKNHLRRFMSSKEISSKVKELQELKRMQAELADEVAALEDAIKAHMDAAGMDTLTTADAKIRGRPTPPAGRMPPPSSKNFRTSQRATPKPLPRAGSLSAKRKDHPK